MGNLDYRRLRSMGVKGGHYRYRHYRYRLPQMDAVYKRGLQVHQFTHSRYHDSSVTSHLLTVSCRSSPDCLLSFIS